jgi:hypothetical protein
MMALETRLKRVQSDPEIMHVGTNCITNQSINRQSDNLFQEWQLFAMLGFPDAASLL